MSFLVDRNNLADQTLAEFQNYRTPGDGRRFTELYPVNKLTSAGRLGSSNVVISTIQRVYKALRRAVTRKREGSLGRRRSRPRADLLRPPRGVP